jgi:Asp-tRNA(Asn)/Glu-tRNA(Gln) amidotransferase A subunit family amidase
MGEGAVKGGAPTARPFLAAAEGFASGADTPRAFLERCLVTLSELEPHIGAFVHLNIEGARAAADRSTERWRAGRPLSPIDGMPVGIKDIIETADMPTEMGSPLFAGWRSERDAASVAALREAGAVVLGKTVTTEFAATEPRGTRNPWDLTRTPGGSSSGSAAAVAAGLVSAALGTQVVGSIIRPASYCGCIGFKPTVGAINRGGSHDALSQSCHGVLAATLEDAWQVAREIASRAGGDPGHRGLAGPSTPPAPAQPRALAFLETPGWAVASPEAKQAMDAVLARLRDAGVAIESRRAPRIDAVEAALPQALPLTRRINAWESRWPLNAYRARDAAKLSRTMLDRLAEAEAMSLDEYGAALDERARIRTVYAELAPSVDACITLSAPGAAPEGLQSTGNPIFAVPASLLGVPALSLPLLSVDGLPLGLQLMGFEHGDAALFAVAAWLRDRIGAAAGGA